ncbi:hypothetical protein C8J57DRAFT_1322719 [Mycena rebaudengoi]|nr:hypothetical protein C8J57DRAFT_1322719 [Mycena rebaudengoi]
MWSGIRTAISGVNQPCQQSAYFALTALGSKLDCLVILGQLSGSSDCLLTICRRYSSSTTSNNSCGHRHQSLQRPSGSKDQQAFPLISPKGSHTATLRLASTTILKRGAMAHPYSGSASYIYANDHLSSPTGPHPKHTSRKHPNRSSTTAVQAVSRTSHDSSWSTEGTYTRTKIPKYDDSGLPPRRSRTQSQLPLIPHRARISHPYQQRNRTSSRAKDDNTVPETEGVHMGRSAVSLPSRETPKMTPYAREGDPLSLRKSAFMPYDQRSFEPTMESSRAMSWRRRIPRRIRDTFEQLKRWMRFQY